MLYLKHYECSECGTTWDDVWDCLCDDRCPSCDTAMTVLDFEEIDDNDPRAASFHRERGAADRVFAADDNAIKDMPASGDNAIKDMPGISGSTT